MRWFSLFVLLLLFWAVLSFQLDEGFLVGAGIVTTAATTILVVRSDLVIRDWGPVHWAMGLVFYLPWLLLQILRANLRVIRLVWHPKLPISPRMVRVPCSLTTHTGRAIYANSITLTPGTVTIDLEANEYLVHALTEDDARDLLEGDMQQRVGQLEPKT